MSCFGFKSKRSYKVRYFYGCVTTSRNIEHIADLYWATQKSRHSKRRDFIVRIWIATGRQRPAVAIFDPSSPENVVSKDVVDWFGAEVYPIQKETRTLGQHTTKNVQGEIYLGWASEETPGEYYEGTFYVSTETNPNYDIILGTISTKALQDSTKKYNSKNQ